MNVTGQPTWSASVDGLRLGLARKGEALCTLTLQNTGLAALSVMSHVAVGGGPQLDWFEVRVDMPGGQVRRLRFVADRDEAAPVCVSLEAGQQLTHDVDLAYWAIQPGNGGRPLAPWPRPMRAGYRVDAAEAGSSWHGSLVTPVLT